MIVKSVIIGTVIIVDIVGAIAVHLTDATRVEVYLPTVPCLDFVALAKRWYRGRSHRFLGRPGRLHNHRLV